MRERYAGCGCINCTHTRRLLAALEAAENEVAMLKGAQISHSLVTDTQLALAGYAAILNRHGPNSAEAEAFVMDHAADEEFVQLAQISRALKKALRV